MPDVPNDAPDPTTPPPITSSGRSYFDALRGELRLYGKSERANILHVKLAVEMLMGIEDDPRPRPTPWVYTDTGVKAAHTATPHVPAGIPDRHLITITDVDAPPTEEVIDAMAQAETAFAELDEHWVNITLPNGAVLTVATEGLDMVPAPPSPPEPPAPTTPAATAEPAAPTTAPPPPVATPPEPEPEPPTTFEGEIGASPAFEEVSSLEDANDGKRLKLWVTIGVGVVGLALAVAIPITLQSDDNSADAPEVVFVDDAPDDQGALDTGDPEPAPGSDDGTDDSATTDGTDPTPGADGDDSVSAVPDGPIVLNPCFLLTDTEVQETASTPWSGVESSAANDNRQICEFYGDGTTNEGAPFLHVEATVNSNSDSFFANFQDSYETSVRELQWGRDGVGEIRAGDGIVSLWAHVIADDPLGRDLFVWIALGNWDDAASGADVVEQLGTRLRDELLANQ